MKEKEDGSMRNRWLSVGALTVALTGVLSLQAGPVWRDPDPVGQDALVVKTPKARLRVDALAENLFRVRVTAGEGWTESALNRYGVITREWPTCAAKHVRDGFSTVSADVAVDSASGAVTFKSRVSAVDLKIDPALVGVGYKVRFSLSKDERIYGLGDVSRENIQRRPGRYEIWVKNVNSYIPIPMAVSSRGWGVFMNTTWRNSFDVGKADPDALLCEAPESALDFYIFCGRDYRALLDIYTRLTGRPAMLPAFGYGFTYVCNENIDMFNLVNDALRFRDMNLPVDVLGLEPGWMAKYAKYDFSVYKRWDRDKFEFGWAPAGGHTFIGALRRMGKKLSLWLCCDYDLFKYEEECATGRPFDFGSQVNVREGTIDSFRDDRIEAGDGRSTLGGAAAEKAKKDAEERRAKALKGLEGPEPWFAHLRKFVQQGVVCFKLDGASQVTEHPRRAWLNGMSDEEAHNLYPLVYGKQMSQGFAAFAKCRPMVYSAGGYAGVQQYVATWAGDTGGGAKPCASLLNLGMSGHANQSCDMGIFDAKSLHFGFLQTWSQENSWAYWFQPWLQPESGIKTFRQYLHLRYSLIPYIYTAAAEAHETGWPVMRPLPFVYPENPKYDECKTSYLFGPDLLVCAYTNMVEVPPGTWYEWRTDQALTGPTCKKLELTNDWGGGLYVRAGAVIPTWPVLQSIERGWNDEIVYEAYVGADGESRLYEDDGKTLAYRKGGKAVANTKLTLTTKDGATSLVIGSRCGGFAGPRTVTVRFHAFAAAPASATIDGKAVEGTWDAKTRVYEIGKFVVTEKGAAVVVRHHKPQVGGS